MTAMNQKFAKHDAALGAMRAELAGGIELPKCRQCGCMKETLESLRLTLPALGTGHALALAGEVEMWHGRMAPTKYACLGCAYCYPAAALNICNEAFPASAPGRHLGCGFEINEATWPPVAGEYFAFCAGEDCPVAVSTLSDAGLAEKLADIRPQGLCIVGKTETENIGVDKLIKNTITNPTIRFLLLTGRESKGHHAGNTLLALSQNGVDADMRVVGSTGRRPILKNVTSEEIGAFRNQLQVVDMIGCEDEQKIVEKIKELSQASRAACGCHHGDRATTPAEISTVPVIPAEAPPSTVVLDKAGYFIILPQAAKNSIMVEHYAYDNTLLRMIEGQDARSLYWTIIQNQWVTLLSHAAYLGKELEKAELAMRLGFNYVQDGA